MVQIFNNTFVNKKEHVSELHSVVGNGTIQRHRFIFLPKGADID